MSFASIKLCLIALAVVLCVGGLAALVVDNRLLAAKVDKDKAEISDYKLANQNLTAIVAQSNAAIKQINDESAARTLAAANAVATAKTASQGYSRSAAALMGSGPVGNDCAAASAFLKKYFSAKQ